MSNSHYYTGVWVNHSRGSISGWTLTLPAAEGQLLVAFLAVFVTLTGSRLWTILSFLLHQFRAGRIPGDGRYQQAQVILRNSGGALGSSWQFVSLGWPWRKVATSSYWGLLMLALLGLLHASSWAVAGVFSSKVTDAVAKEALVQSQHCGYYGKSNNATDGGGSFGFSRRRILEMTTDAATYARLCYGQSKESPFCNRYAVPQLPWTGDTNVSCPFDPSFCRLNGTAAAFRMDTGLLSSQSIFGFNTGRSDEIGYRRVTTCAPIKPPTGFHELVNNTSSDGSPGNYQYLRFYLGPNSVANWTYEYNIDTIPANGGYKLSTLYAVAAPLPNPWTPIPQLNRTDADVSLYFLGATSISYTEPVDDPWFSANIPFEIHNQTYYMSDSYIRIIGCTEQHQFCNLNLDANDSSCTPLTASMPAFNAAYGHNMSFSDLQLQLVARLVWVLPQTLLSQSVTSEVSLQAYNSLSDQFSGPLPSNQWQIEMSNWFNIALAKSQGLLLEVSTGPAAIRPGGTIKPLYNKLDQSLCFMQRVPQTANYNSFSVLGIVIILVVSGLIIFVSFFIDTLVGSLQRISGKGLHKATQWLLDDKLQLQRMVYEKSDIGPWTNCDAQVPVTTKKMENMGIISSLGRDEHPTYGRGYAEPSAIPSVSEDEMRSLKGGYVSLAQN